MEKKMNLNGELFFPIEIIFEILSRLAASSLMRCKCVCKQWNEIIQHHKFIEMHMLRSREQFSKYYISKDETFTISDIRHGLLVEKSEISGMYRVRNPATKQILALPDPEEEPIFMMIVFLASTSSYKLVSVYEVEGKITGKIGFKVLNFEDSDLSWRTVDCSYLREFDRLWHGMLLNMHGRFLYCIALYEDEFVVGGGVGGGSGYSEMHCLDVENEILRGSPIIVPRSFFCNWENVMLGKWDEKSVALMNIVEDDLHVWALEDPIKGKWSEKMMIFPLTFLKRNSGMKETLSPFWASHEKIWFTKDDDEDNFITYCIRSKQAWESQFSTPPGKIFICNGSGSLVTLKGMQPEKKPNSDDFVQEILTKLVKLAK